MRPKVPKNKKHIKKSISLPPAIWECVDTTANLLSCSRSNVIKHCILMAAETSKKYKVNT